MQPMLKIVAYVLAVLSLAIPLSADVSGFKNSETLELNGVEIKVYTYSPLNCEHLDLLLVFHGVKRNAKSLRDKAIKLADEHCLVVYSPLFDSKRFVSWRYQRMGVSFDGALLSSNKWTSIYIHHLISIARKRLRNPETKLYMFGHSAGGQFLSRLAAYSSPEHVQRIVIANPSTYVFPSLKIKAPYGFEMNLENLEEEVLLQNYLALPITIYLGREDVGTQYLVKNKEARHQGENRLQRGRNTFNFASSIASNNGWVFNWQLIEVPNVGHSSKKMLNAPLIHDALNIP